MLLHFIFNLIADSVLSLLQLLTAQQLLQVSINQTLASTLEISFTCNDVKIRANYRLLSAFPFSISVALLTRRFYVASLDGRVDCVLL